MKSALKAVLLVLLLSLVLPLFSKPVLAAPFCTNQNKAGIMIDTHYADFGKAADLVGPGGWVVVLAFPSTCSILQNEIASRPDVNIVIWGMPGKGTVTDANGWCATLAKLDTHGNKVFFKPWNTANSNDPNDTYAVKGNPQQVAAYQNALYSCLSKTGLLDNKVILLSPVLITLGQFAVGTATTAYYKDYFNAIPASQKQYVARSLYDILGGQGVNGVCTASGYEDNACKTKDFLDAVGGQYTFAVEGSTADPPITYEDAKIAALINKMAITDPKDPNYDPGNWAVESSFVMGAMYANDPDSYGQNWRLWKDGPKTMAAYKNFRKPGCVTPIDNQGVIDQKFNTWFASLNSSIVSCGACGFASSDKFCVQQSDNTTGPTGPTSGDKTGGNNGFPPGAIVGPTFPSLGSLQTCPPEVPAPSPYPKEVPQQTPPPPAGGACGLPAKPEPVECLDATLIDKNGVRAKWCEGMIRDCYPEHLGIFTSTNDGGYDCGGGKEKTHDYGRTISTFCQGGPENKDPIHQLWLQFNAGVQSGACMDLKDIAPKDQVNMEICLGYFSKQPAQSQTVKEQQVGLPVCVPTYDPTRQCVSECGEPVNFTQTLLMSSPIAGCLRGGGGATCFAQVGITGGTLAMPFAQKLGDYFAGVLDAEHSTIKELDRIQTDLRNGIYQEAFAKAGVIGRLMPEVIQDKLKCDFINYVQNKKVSGLNTKYLERLKDPKTGQLALTGREFMIYDKKITDLYGHCAPDRAKYGPTGEDAYAKAKVAWQQDYGKYWNAVPLFQNDDSQGEIQFVSPSLFSTNYDKNGPVPVGPIYVTLPEIARLDEATREIQAALVPAQLLNLPDNPTPIGKPITPIIADDKACTPTRKITDYYSQTTLAQDQLGHDMGLSEFDRGVSCLVPTLPGDNEGKICTIGPKGEINCAQEDNSPGATDKAGTIQRFEEKVQVRTVFPHLYQIADQTISPERGLLQLFKPAAVQKLMSLGLNQTEALSQFDLNFEPVPASISGVHYEIEQTSGIQIDDASHEQNGWQLFFYRLGGLVNAKNFLLNLLNGDKSKQ